MNLRRFALASSIALALVLGCGEMIYVIPDPPDDGDTGSESGTDDETHDDSESDSGSDSESDSESDSSGSDSTETDTGD